VIELIKGVRSVRAEMNVPAGAKIPLILKGASHATAERLARHKDVISTLARLESIGLSENPPRIGITQFAIEEAVVVLRLDAAIDLSKERARLEKDLKKTQDEIARFDAKLSNEQFVSKAPEEVLAEQREKRTEAQALASRLTEMISRLPE
jgi:valyl-tRNA synthetase